MQTRFFPDVLSRFEIYNHVLSSMCKQGSLRGFSKDFNEISILDWQSLSQYL